MIFVDTVADIVFSTIGEGAMEVLARALRIKTHKGKRWLAVALAVLFLATLLWFISPFLVV